MKKKITLILMASVMLIMAGCQKTSDAPAELTKGQAMVLDAAQNDSATSSQLSSLELPEKFTGDWSGVDGCVVVHADAEFDLPDAMSVPTAIVERKPFSQADADRMLEVFMKGNCHYKVRHPGECDGQSGYGVSKLDEIIDKVVRMQLERIRDNPCDSIVLQQYEKSLELAKARYNIAYAQMMEKQKELDDYQAEIIRIIRGQSRLSAEMINGLIEKTKAELEVLSENYIESDRYLKEKQGNWATEQEEYKRLKSWADVYDKCSFQTKKMFISYFVKAIYVYRDYDLEIEFNVSFDEFKHFSAK